MDTAKNSWRTCLKLFKALNHFLNKKIQITTNCDIFCAYCPHNNGKCSESSYSNEKIRAFEKCRFSMPKIEDFKGFFEPRIENSPDGH